MTQKIFSFGSLNYDVPRVNRPAYAKIKRLLRRKAIMQTMSSYLFPWGMAPQIEEGLHRINLGADGLPLPPSHQVRFKIFKYDEEVSGQALHKSAKVALDNMLTNAKECVNRLIGELVYDTSDSVDPVRTAKGSCRRFRQTLRDARMLALVFNLTSNMNAGFLAYEAWIIAKRQEVQDWIEQNQAVEVIENSEGEAAVNSAEPTLVTVN